MPSKHLIASVLLVAVLFSACKYIQPQLLMRAEKPRITHRTFGDLEVVFCELHHVGRPAYYEAVTEHIKTFKEARYTVFYEGVSHTRPELGPGEYDLVAIKLRRMVGINPTRKMYNNSFADGKKNLISEPSYEELSVDSLDIHADISKTEAVNAYERNFGPIPLDSNDYHTPLDSFYMRFMLPRVQTIIVDYRNQRIAEQILASGEKKILLLYGAGHRKGILRLLRQGNRQK